MPVIALLGALDTKAWSMYSFKTGSLNLAPPPFDRHGVLCQPGLSPFLERERIAELGGGDITELRRTADRNASMTVMARGLRWRLQTWSAEGQ
ncbi:hypothetical protein F1D05_29930 [Kribbella qitaiheensis]|uniref:Uncharacterized protein n=1 Tax=Kribbella qitaiheensis TaxID=1544730 RepID=A0A7G6X556_9ACTN|nr:hypothetical protein [Kribbella qitaiheensis]QNE21371.1 hypothetical protein F1D05_29930 [Kribbella qitaiheensis]